MTILPPIPRPLSDFGNALRLADLHGWELKFAPELGWLAWDGRRWRTDEAQAYRLAFETVQTIPQEAAVRPVAEWASLLRWAQRSEQAARIRAMLELARALPEIAARADEFDSHEFILTCANGILLLDADPPQLLPHDPNLRCTKLAGAPFDPTAGCPRWLQFLDEVTGSDPELQEYLQQVAGLTLVGIPWQEIFILWGSGGNGKTTFIEVLRRVLGDYAVGLPFGSLLRTRANSIPADIARLRGARMAVASEAPPGTSFDGALLKQLAGNDTVTARHLYKPFFDFKPTCKLLLACNHLPAVDDSSEGLWRRLKVIPFDVVVPPLRRDPGLLDKLLAEAAGILAWAVAGWRAVKAAGLRLSEPGRVTGATAEYRRQTDLLGAFLEDRTEPEPGAYVCASVLQAAFAEWARAQGLASRARRVDLAQELPRRGYPRDRLTAGPDKGRVGYFGLRLKPAALEIRLPVGN